MFGVTNPPAAPGGKNGSTSVAVAMDGWANSGAGPKSMVAAVQNNAAMTPEAWAWGAGLDTATFSGADMPAVMENVLWVATLPLLHVLAHADRPDAPPTGTPA